MDAGLYNPNNFKIYEDINSSHPNILGLLSIQLGK